MAIKLKRSLFIGLGGTGMKSILKTKSMYEELFGEVPPVIGFLGIDTNLLEYQTIAANYEGTSFAKGEEVSMPISEAQVLYECNKEDYPWISKKNTVVLQYLRNEGAGQLRSSGRFIFEYNEDNVQMKISNAVNNISAATIPASDKWELDAATSNVQIYVVFSLSGGTGCGSFLSLGYLLRHMYGTTHDIYAYAVLPGAFAGCGEYVGANAYGAALDIDYLISNVSPERPFPVKIGGKTKYFTTQPYDLYYFVDNVNGEGTRYNNQDQIHTMLGHAFLAISGLLSSQIAGKHSNYKVDIASSVYDHGDKKGWVMGHGLCEIKIDRKKLQKTFALKAAMNLVGDILGGTNTKVKVGEEANGWILSNNLCEHNYDQLLDSLYDFSMLPQSVIASSKSAEARLESDTWVKSEEDKAVEKVHSSYSNRLDEIQKAVDDKIKDVISMYGLNGAKTFVESLQSSFATYEEEMKNELEILRSAQSLLIADKDNVIESWRKTIFGGAGEYRPKLQAAQYELLKNKVDIMRHTKAQQFYLVLKEKLSSLDSKLNASIVMFNSISEAFNKMVATLSAKKDVNPFVKDLSGNIPVTGEHPNNTVSAFIKSNPDLLEMASLPSDEVTSKIEAFTSSLDGADFSDVSVEDQILSLPADKITELFTDAMRKAAVLLEVKGHGKKVNGATDAYISLPSGQNSRLTKVPEIVQTIKSFVHSVNDPTYVASSSNSSILIYLISGGYPVFQIETIVKQKDTYEEKLANKSLSFDMALEKKILDEHFGFDPNSRRDDDMLELWVKGFIFEMIKKNGNEYVLKSRQLATSMNGTYAMRLPEGAPGTERRAYAYEVFTNHKNTLQGNGELKEKIREQEMALGRNELLKKYKEFAQMAEENPTEYLKRFAGLSMETVDNINPAYERTRRLLSDELTYCREQLVKSIDSVF